MIPPARTPQRKKGVPAAMLLPFAFAMTLLFLCLPGCRFLDGSYYDTYQVDKEALQTIDPVSLQDMIRSDRKPADQAAPEASQPQPPETLALSLTQCRALALENNLDLRVQMLQPAIQAEGVTEAKAAFEPLAFSNFSFAEVDTPTALTLEANKSESIRADAGIRVPLHTGGSITLDFPFSRTETDNIFSVLNPFYTSDLSLSISHPLLRGAGLKANTHGIRIARYNWEGSLARTRLEVVRVLASVDRVYWRLFAARQELAVRKQEHDLAVAQLESARRKFKLKDVAEIEVFRAEEAASQRIEAIILAENQVRDRERELKQVLNKPGLDMASPTRIITETPPNPARYVLDKQKLLSYAMAHRMELVELELQLAAQLSTIDYLDNARLPDLLVSYTYNINALGDSVRESYDLLFENRFADHVVTAALQVPLGNQAARSRYRRALREKERTLADQARRTALIQREVLAAADQLEADWQRIAASRKNVILAQRTLAEETHRFENKLQSSIDVLNAQVRYAQALSLAHQALVAYQIAQVDLAYAVGGLLGAAKIEWEGGE